MDNQVTTLIEKELDRQQNELELIASENYVSQAVMQSMANVFTNKYSEGYPDKRYYGGQKWVDRLEILCQWRALRMFGLLEGEETTADTDAGYEQLKHEIATCPRGVNVQALSGSPVNLAVYMWCIKPGDTILGMDLGAGGHLSHGHPLNASGLYYNIVPYGVDEQTHMVDYEQVRALALEHKPALILAGFSAYPRTIDWSKFSAIADEVLEVHGYRPIVMADVAHVAGLIAGGAYPSPFPHVDIVTTTTHKSLRGPRGALAFMKSGERRRNGKEINLEKMINRGVFPGVQGGPHQHITAAKAVAFKEVIDADFADYAQRVVHNAQVLAETLRELGWQVETGGTDNHLVLFDITVCKDEATGLTGKSAEKILEDIGISCNKNMLPFDTRSPMNPSGIRLGTPAVTTRGLEALDLKEVATVISDALLGHEDEKILSACKERIHTLCKKFPLRYNKVEE